MNKKRWISIISILVLVISLVGCGSSSSNNGSSDVKSEQEYDLNNPDFWDAESFEKALNNKEDVVGKTVRFCVVKYEPKSSLGIIVNDLIKFTLKY